MIMNVKGVLGFCFEILCRPTKLARVNPALRELIFVAKS